MFKNKILFFLFMIILSFSAYYIDLNKFTQNISSNNCIIDKLKNETYYLPVKKFSHSEVVYQPLERFDMIFTGHDINISTPNFELTLDNVSAITPGYYTHMLMYIGKDADGFAYAVEMNTDENKTFRIDSDGMYIGGGFHLTCIGKDYTTNTCPKNIDYSLNDYDYLWAKRLKPNLRKKLVTYEYQLMRKIKEDLINEYPFQIPFDIDIMTPINKVAPLIEDGHENGSDCISYFISLFEEVAQVCPKGIRINALELTLYYQNTFHGQHAVLPKKYNFSFHENIRIKTILEDLGIVILDNQPRQTTCSDNREVIGIPIPDLLYNSIDLVNIQSLKR